MVCNNLWNVCDAVAYVKSYWFISFLYIKETCLALKTYLKWTDLNFNWMEIERSGVPMIWSDISLISEVEKIMRGSGPQAYFDYVKDNPWERLSKQIGESKSEKFIKIFCTINEIKYEDIKKVNNNIKISISHFERVFNEGIKIKVIL